MLYLLIILCFCVLLYVLKNIMSEILILRADIEFLKDNKSKDIIKKIINEKKEGIENAKQKTSYILRC